MQLIKNILAVIGALSLILLIVLFLKAQEIMNRIETFDEHAFTIYSEFLSDVYETGSAVDAMVYRVAVKPGLSAEAVDTSIRQIANELNIKSVGELALYREVEAITGKPYRYAKIYMLCNAMTAASILNYNDAFASILPCRLSLIEDQAGKLWLYTLNLDLMLHGGKPMPPALKSEAIKVRDTLKEIMHRSAEGDF